MRCAFGCSFNGSIEHVEYDRHREELILTLEGVDGEDMTLTLYAPDIEEIREALK